MDKLLLLDGHSLAYRAFFALPAENFATSTGQVTNAVYGFTSMLINVLRDEQPSHVAVAFDLPQPTFRHERYQEYKANRSKAPDEFRSQLPLIKEVCAALGITTLEAPGFEADDVIATLATQASAREMETLIVTGDRDSLQLVTGQVTVLMTGRGVSDLRRYTPDAVQEKYGLSPAQYPDFAALRGDSSDNLPGIPGVGEKTATKWIVAFGSLAGLVDRVTEVTGKAGESLRENLASVLRNRELTELVRDVPLSAGPDQLRPRPWDRDEIHQLFDTLQFRVLRDRLYQYLPHGIGGSERAAPPSGRIEVAGVLLGPGQVREWLEGLTSSERAGVAVHGTWTAGTGDITAIAISVPGEEDGTGAYLDPAGLTPDDERALAAWLADPERPKVLHDAKGPGHALAARGLPLAGLACDTALAAYLALPGQRSFDLADLVLRYLGKELAGSEPEGQLTLDGSWEREAALGLVAQAAAVRELAGALEADLAKRGGLSLLNEMELPLLPVLAAMERTGIAVDTGHFEQMSGELGAQVKEAERAAHAAVGREFNLGSPKQLQEVLFTELGLPKTKRIKTGYTTDSEALTSLVEQTGHPVLEQLLRFRDVAKLKSVVDGLIPLAAADGRIHTTFNQTVAATGRLSSADPNLQNIPIRTGTGRRIREGFVAGAGYQELLSADYSQIELRIMAHLSGDQALIEAFESGHDFHAATAARVFGVDPGQVTPEMRAKIKAMNYGLAYGLSGYGLSQQLRIPAAEAQALREEYFTQFGGVRDYLKSLVAEASTRGYTETMAGRRRYLPDLTSENRQRREMAERMALNAPVQGSAADIIKTAMLAVDRALRDQRLSSRMLLQVHDELIVEVAPGETEQVADVIRSAMAGAAELRVPLEVATGTGRTWARAAH